MHHRPDIRFIHAAQPQRRLALGLAVSAALHGLWLGLAHPPALSRLPSDTAAPAPLTLTLAAPVARRVAPVAGSSASVAHGAAPAATARPAPVPPQRPQPAAAPARVRPLPAGGAERDGQAPARRPPAPRPADPAGAAAAPRPAADAAPAPRALSAPDAPDAPEAADAADARNAPAGAAPPSASSILAAARHDAAAIARDLNHAPGSKAEFRSRAQEELDRRFDAAHAAGGSWFRSARVEEITTAADGSRRVYRVVTPLGTFCRTYYGDGSRPMNTTCPR